uniref:NADH-ubiquinone oxidoreductase chain 6 n=1 Tax=Peltorhamphus novaezeelandiae TaxID=526620 RepID=W5QKW3_9PLEU|nr:NADH dehydrogenase subunit 6 [Peltorhamphus novaezeelandiae]AFH09409.1 NADH dehydrogenase subunit 6 [Peltorhamphus novaezeelandiae]
MTFIMYLLLFLLVLGLVAVASNPSPYFAALGLVLAAGAGCGVLVGHGGPFLSLILFLIYLGGMLVVFAYSAALAAEPYPESWGSRPVLAYIGMYSLGVVGAFSLLTALGHGPSLGGADMAGELGMFRGDMEGVAMVYCSGGVMLIITAYILLLALLVVLELTRGLSRGTLRAV